MTKQQKDIRLKALLNIKKIAEKDKNGDCFIVIRTEKNNAYIREKRLTLDKIKNIVKALSVKDCFKGPEYDRDSNYDGFLYFFNPMYEGEELYIKIRVENVDKAICLSIHRFGEY